VKVGHVSTLTSAPPRLKLCFNLAIYLLKLCWEVSTAHLNASLTAVNDSPKLPLSICGQVVVGKFNPGFNNLTSPFGEAAHVGVWHAQSPEKRAASTH
jgi:hypothetical protein